MKAGDRDASGAIDGFDDARLRRARVQQHLVDAGVDALIIASPGNFTYVTGYTTPSWAITARPLVLVLTETSCTAVLGAGEVEAFQRSCPDLPVVPYTDPVRCEIDGFILADFATAAGARVSSILRPQRPEVVAVEGSLPSASGLPYETIREIAARLNCRIVDGSPMLLRLRQRKTEWELTELRRAGLTIGQVYERFQASAGAGMTAREVEDLIVTTASAAGADRVGYLTVSIGNQSVAGLGDNRRWRRGELIYIDVGLVVGGYWADISRHFAAGDIDEEYARNYRGIVRAVAAGRMASRPTATAAEVAAAIAAELPKPHVEVLGSIGRMGHGVGLDLTEPPSVSVVDETVLETGMTLAIEPLGAFARGILMAEENLVVGENSPVLLSPAFPDEIPLVAG